jgi:hypothetical protein
MSDFATRLRPGSRSLGSTAPSKRPRWRRLGVRSPRSTRESRWRRPILLRPMARSATPRVLIDGREGALSAVRANKQSIETQISAVLPARKASAEAALDQAQVELDKTVVYAGLDGTVEQFALRVGDIVNPLMRPAGILIPTEAVRQGLFAGFAQIEAQVMKVGMIAEVACISKPFTVIPMVVTQVQEVVAAGQVRPTDVLIDTLQVAKPGTITVVLEPLYAGGLEGVPPTASATPIRTITICLRRRTSAPRGDCSCMRWTPSASCMR